MVDTRASFGLFGIVHLDPDHHDRVRPVTGVTAGRDPGSGTRWRARCRLAATALLAAAAAAAATVTAAGPAAAIGPGSTGAFSLTPAPASNGTAPPYFMLNLGDGQSARATAILVNLGSTSEQLRLSKSTGTTAANGGSAFDQSFQHCTGPGCWITGLPGVLTLPADTRDRISFTVDVPARTDPGQYLAGVTAEPARLPRAVPLGSNGHSGARAIIIEQVTVAVAVTVGRLSTLTTRLNIPTVQGGAVGQLHRLEITLDNTGRTFTHGTGTASCVSGGQMHTYAVYADTVLPGGQAVIPVNASALPGGTPIPCTVKIHYGDGKTVTWTGRVVLPSPPQVRIVHTGPGAYSVLPDQGIPAWAIALMVIGACVLAGLVVTLYRNRRRTTAGQQE
jgi:hypothetical protein